MSGDSFIFATTVFTNTLLASSASIRIFFSSIAGFSFGREPPEHSVVTSEVVGLVLMAVDAQAAELMAVEAPLLGDIEAALGAVRAVLALAAVESAPALAKAVELLAPMAA